VLRRYSPIAPAGVGMMLARRLGQAVILDLSRHLCRSAEAWRYVVRIVHGDDQHIEVDTTVARQRRFAKVDMFTGKR